MHKLINTVSAIKSVENLNMIISFVFPKLRNNTRVTDDKDTGNMIDDQVKQVKLKRIKFELYTEPDLDQT